MSDDNTVHVGDVGTAFWITLMDGSTVLNPADAISARFFLQRKSKTDILEVIPEVATDPLDSVSKFRYVTKEGDLSVAGPYILQAYARTTNGQWHTSTYTFTVSINLRDVPLLPDE